LGSRRSQPPSRSQLKEQPQTALKRQSISRRAPFQSSSKDEKEGITKEKTATYVKTAAMRQRREPGEKTNQDQLSIQRMSIVKSPDSGYFKNKEFNAEKTDSKM